MNPYGILGILAAIALVLGGSYKCGSDAGIRKDAERSDKIIAQKDELILGCQGELATAEADVQAKEALIEDNNTRILTLQAEAEARAAANAKALRAARAEADGFRTRADRIAAMQSGPDQCESTRAMFVDILKAERQ